MSSSLTPGLVRIPLVEVFTGVPDPRARRGVRHDLQVILTVAAAAVLGGARTLLAVSQWATDAGPELLEQCGIDPGVGVPCESTIRRTLARLDPGDLDARIGGWLATRVGVDARGRRVIAVDGKTLRGSRTRHRGGVHLVAAFDHTARIVLGQHAVDAKSNEIPAVKDLLTAMNRAGVMDLNDAVVTADALHCQRDTATWLTDHGADYVLTVKDNQRRLRRELSRLPWAKIPARRAVDRSHSRTVTRTIKAVTCPRWVDWPGAAQVIQIRRTATRRGKKTTEIVYAICSVPMDHADPGTVAGWVQGHWGIENALHWVRDVTFDEDRHHLRTGNGPQVMATLRNTAISLVRLTGHTNIAAALRHHHRHPEAITRLLTIP